MRRVFIFVPFILALSAATAVASGQAQVIPAADAARVFARAHALCAADAGQLWGVSLCAPMMLADPDTRQAVLNQPAPGAARDGDVYRIMLPAGAIVSTAPLDFWGTRWATILWPFTGSADFQAVELMHESFHVVQPKLGFTGYAGEGSISGDAELDMQAGRIWLRGELHALSAALQSSGQARKAALQDGLAMRSYRDALLVGTAEEERQQDVMEGLAEGTGIDAGLPADGRVAYALNDITFVEAQPSYARSFPYATGPAYSELLDAADPSWRRRLTLSSDVAAMAMHAYGMQATTPTAAQAQMILARYGGAEIQSQETARARRKAALAVKYKRELVSGTTIVLPMTHFGIKFNPRDIETFDPYGSVYHTLTVTAPWGEVDVEDGDAMISKDFRALTIAAPSGLQGKTLLGAGYTLHLAPGYAVTPDPQKAGSYVVTAQPTAGR